MKHTIFLLILFFFSIHNGICQVFIFQPEDPLGKDAHVLEESPDDNYGSSNLLYLGGTINARVNLFIEFDLSSITPGTKINTARLDFYVDGGNGWYYYDYGIYKVGSVWDESTITWNNQPSDITIIDTVSTYDWPYYSWNSIHGLESLVQEWVV